MTRTGSGGGSNLAVGKPISASSFIHTYAAQNANDNSTSTYWGGGGQLPEHAHPRAGANADVDSVVLKLNPDTSWSKRTQNIQVLDGSRTRPASPLWWPRRTTSSTRRAAATA